MSSRYILIIGIFLLISCGDDKIGTHVYHSSTDNLSQEERDLNNQAEEPRVNIPVNDYSEFRNKLNTIKIDKNTPIDVLAMLIFDKSYSTRLMGFCSSILISSDYVLTNSHCLPDDLVKRMGKELNKPVTCRKRMHFAMNNENYPDSKKILDCESVKFATNRENKLSRDLALIKLSKSVDEDIKYRKIDTLGIDESNIVKIEAIDFTYRNNYQINLKYHPRFCKSVEKTIANTGHVDNLSSVVSLINEHGASFDRKGEGYECDIIKGNSGSGLIQNGRIVGVVQSGIVKRVNDRSSLFYNKRFALGSNIACSRELKDFILNWDNEHEKNCFISKMNSITAKLNFLSNQEIKNIILEDDSVKNNLLMKNKSRYIKWSSHFSDQDDNLYDHKIDETYFSSKFSFYEFPQCVISNEFVSDDYDFDYKRGGIFNRGTLKATVELPTMRGIVNGKVDKYLRVSYKLKFDVKKNIIFNLLNFDDENKSNYKIKSVFSKGIVNNFVNSNDILIFDNLFIDTDTSLKFCSERVSKEMLGME